MSGTHEEYTFDDILEEIGSNGKFQKRFRIVFNFILVFFASMPYLNIIYAIVVPDHWCKVPGREFTNMSLEEWRNFTIPRNDDTNERNVFSKCQMYNVTFTNRTEFDQLITSNYKNEIIECQNGWEYDTRWYKNTVPSQENWVCHKKLNVANSFAVAKFGEVIGTLFFGQLGDSIGRKKVFFITIIIIITGRCSLTFASGNIYWWLLFIFIGSSTSTAVFISPLIIAMEICNNNDRTYITMLQFASCTFAICFMPLLMWIVGDWMPFVLITTLPCTLFLFSNRLIIESPRWLATRGKMRRCVKELSKIARVNNTRLPDAIEMKLEKIGSNNEKVYGVMSLFSSWRLAKNSVLVIVCWVITVLVYFPLTLNVVNLGGNPFINYFLQALAELPAYIIGKFSCDNIGRRWTTILAFLACFLGNIPVVFFANKTHTGVITIASTVFIKFAVSLAAYSNQLQVLEIYPTCIRQTGQAVGAVISHASAILGPYIVFLGNTYPYAIGGVLSFIGVVSGFFLPETLNANLPETLAEARAFGADQKYMHVFAKKSYTTPQNNEK